MSKKINGNHLNANAFKRNAQERKSITFSWKYLTTSKNYTFSSFANDMRKEMEARRALSSLVIELSSLSWYDILCLKKNARCGFEQLQLSDLNFSPNGYFFASDEKVAVFRFGNQKYRMIGIMKEDTLHIIGYDFDYSAYNHGS